MDFSGQYLNYKDYKVLGGTLDIMPFNLLEYEARKILDARTQGRIKEVNQDIKMCINAMISVLNSYKTYETQNKAIASENTDGYSISYVGGNKATEEAKMGELEDIMQNYLLSSGLLYLGVC